MLGNVECRLEPTESRSLMSNVVKCPLNPAPSSSLEPPRRGFDVRPFVSSVCSESSDSDPRLFGSALDVSTQVV